MYLLLLYRIHNGLHVGPFYANPPTGSLTMQVMNPLFVLARMITWNGWLILVFESDTALLWNRT